ncbi:thiamine pyridinylase [Massilia sp. W12]|uniref:thiamine pyridinylase n=1 Tax=Massilia sp. W12 TaxID=3126507 RepID=UPI0030D35BB9
MRTCLRLLLLPLLLFCQLSLAQTKELNVALYPWVPRVAQFEQAISNHWKKIHPDVKLNFIKDFSKWDGGYGPDPADDLDVFVFDAIYFDHYLMKNYLEPMAPSSVGNPDDFIDYAKTGVMIGDKYYAVPQLGCANLLFYRKGDAALAAVKTLSELDHYMGQCKYASRIPPGKDGLLIDMAGSTTTALLYLDALHRGNGIYPPRTPKDEYYLVPGVIDFLRNYISLASYENATKDVSAAYQRARWFSDGYGRALMAYSEALSVMSAQTRRETAVKLFPLANRSGRPLFYSDVIGVNRKTHQRGVRDLAVRLAALMASSEVMQEAIGPDAENPEPQYLLAARHSVFKQLGAQFPLYRDLYQLVQESNPQMFKLGPDARAWLSNWKKPIVQQVRANPACGCDQLAATYISTAEMAKEVCPNTCNALGGWAGGWSNQYPAAPFGRAVCACKACSL